MVKSFKDLIVWQRAFELALDVYGLTARYPRHELFGLTSETRKTARQVAYSIAEGHRRRSRADFLRFLDYSRSSAGELETQLLFGDRFGYLDRRDSKRIFSRRSRVDILLLQLIRSLKIKE